jgi:hypothetical protein
MTDTPQEPLWRLIESAFLAGRNPGFSDRHGYAAEIRAVADWLVPPELEQLEAQNWAVRVKWRTGLALRQRLLAEADRAERGDA